MVTTMVNTATPEFDAVIEKSRTTTDAADTLQHFMKQKICLWMMLHVSPVAYYNDFYLMSDKVTGAWHASNGYWYFMYADITE